MLRLSSHSGRFDGGRFDICTLDLTLLLQRTRRTLKCSFEERFEVCMSISASEFTILINDSVYSASLSPGKYVYGN